MTAKPRFSSITSVNRLSTCPARSNRSHLLVHEVCLTKSSISSCAAPVRTNTPVLHSGSCPWPGIRPQVLRQGLREYLSVMHRSHFGRMVLSTSTFCTGAFECKKHSTTSKKSLDASSTGCSEESADHATEDPQALLHRSSPSACQAASETLQSFH